MLKFNKNYLETPYKFYILVIIYFVFDDMISKDD